MIETGSSAFSERPLKGRLQTFQAVPIAIEVSRYDDAFVYRRARSWIQIKFQRSYKLSARSSFATSLSSSFASPSHSCDRPPDGAHTRSSLRAKQGGSR